MLAAATGIAADEGEGAVGDEEEEGDEVREGEGEGGSHDERREESGSGRGGDSGE